MSDDSGADDTVHEQVRRARAAAARAARLRARASRARDDAVAVVSVIVTRHGDRLLPPGLAAGEDPAAAPAAPESLSSVFTVVGVRALRKLVMQVARGAGLDDDDLADLVLAVHELMTNAVRHGGGWGRVQLRRDGDLLVCVLTDYGPGLTGEADRGELPAPHAEGGRGLFLARRLTNSLHVRSGVKGTVITVTMKLPDAPNDR